MTVKITYRNGWYHDCDSIAGWVPNEVGLAASLASDGDVFTITGQYDNVADEYVTYEYALGASAWDTNSYPKLFVRWRTSEALNGLEAKIGVSYVTGTWSQWTLGFSTTWKVTACTLDSGKVVSSVWLKADDNPDTLGQGGAVTSYVYFDWILACAGQFTFPHVAPGGVRVTFPVETATVGRRLQNLGADTPAITLTGDVLPGEAWSSGATVPPYTVPHFNYFLSNITRDTWCYFTCDNPPLRCQVMPKNFDVFQSSGDKSKLQWEWQFLLYKLNGFDNSQWISGANDWYWLYGGE